MAIELAADLGYGIPWLVLVLTVAIAVASAFFLYVVLSTKSKHVALSGIDRAKYQLHKYHAERYWAVVVAGLLIWLWYLGYSWMPSVAFSEAEGDPNVHVVKITARQWAWSIEDGGTGQNISAGHDSASGGQLQSQQQEQHQLHVKAGETVKFVARSMDVNHGFSILSSDRSMDPPLMQMQVVPGHDNIFYFTFDKPGNYTIRCLEYCGWNHPFMTSQITISAA